MTYTALFVSISKVLVSTGQKIINIIIKSKSFSNADQDLLFIYCKY